MALKLYTFRGKHTGRTYYATGHTVFQAAREIGISHRHLILERSEKIPCQPRIECEIIQLTQPTPN